MKANSKTEKNMADDHKVPPTPATPADELSRRKFVKLGLGCLTACGVGAGVFSYQYLSPNVLYEPSPVVNVGKPDQYPPDSVTLHAGYAIYIIHSDEGFYALNAICTHLGCLTAWKQDLNMIACPCHGSRFDRSGTKIAGPAPKPLQWLQLWFSDDGELMVDRSVILANRQFVKA